MQDELTIHEVLHMSSFLMNAVATELLEHPAIRNNKKWRKKARTAHQELFDLYQEIGSAS